LYTRFVLQVEAMTKRYGRTVAVDGLDLAVDPGEIVGLIGRNGAGKSTFDRLVAGIEPVDAGRIRIDGVDLARDRRSALRRLGLAGQEVALYPTATVAENLMLFAGVQGLRRVAARRAVADTCIELQLADLLDRPVARLSGGQQRRVHAAAAMLHRPGLLLLDEPTVGADPVSRRALLGAVRRRANDGAAVIYTTHYLPELDLLGATVALVVHGRVVARGVRAQVLEATGASDLEALLREDETLSEVADAH
jgi:ABC-2 type transport system ATP-binding protein